MNRETVVKSSLALLGVAWLFAVTVCYYIVHKPFASSVDFFAPSGSLTIGNLLAILNALSDILVALAIVVLASVVGRRMTRPLNFASPLEAIVLQTGIGLGLVSFCSLALGLIGFLNPILFWSLLLLCLLLFRNELAALWRDLRGLKLPITSRFDHALAIFIVLVLALTFILALMPPTAWDAQTYHLVEAKIALEQGRIAAPPDIVYFSFPSLVEMIYLAAMLLKGDIVTQLIHWSYLVLILGAVFAFALRYFNNGVAWLAGALFVAVPSLVALSSWAYVDLALAFYALAAFYAVTVARQTDEWQWFALAGAFTGLALGVKYTAVIIPIALLCLLLRKGSKTLVSYFSFTALFAAPWYLRNLIFTGNPVYPFLFGGQFWDAFRAEQFSRFGTGMVGAPLQLLTAPWDATILGREGTVIYDATVGPLLLALLPLLILSLGKFRSPVLRDLLLFSAGIYAFWLIGLAESKLLMQTRLLFPVFPLVSLAASVAVDRLNALTLPQFSLQRFTRLFILLILFLTATSYSISVVSDNPFAYLGGFESRDEYLARHLGSYYAAMQFVNQNLPVKSKALFLWEPRSYYARRQVQPDVILDAFGDRRSKQHDADSIAAALRNEGYTHLLLNRAGLDYLLQTGYDPITSDDVVTLGNLVSQDLKQVYGKTPFQIVTRDGRPSVLGAQDDQYAVYEIVSSKLP